jgi:hypothetical protein
LGERPGIDADTADACLLNHALPVAHGEKNYLLNTRHPDFKRVRFSSPSPFVFDPRLK